MVLYRLIIMSLELIILKVPKTARVTQQQEHSIREVKARLPSNLEFPRLIDQIIQQIQAKILLIPTSSQSVL